MNNQRRKEIDSLIAQVEVLRERIEHVLDEEQEYLDNMPENLQCSERAETSGQAVENLESARDELETSVLEYLQAAQE